MPSGKTQPASTDRKIQPPAHTSHQLNHSDLSWLGIILIIIAGATAYHNSLDGEFIYDDIPQIVNNPRIHSLPSLQQVLSGRRPVSDLTLALNDYFHQQGVWGYHVVNVVIHILSGLTLFGLVRRTLIIRDSSRHHHNEPTFLALLIALLWLVHPLQTQSVNYTIQRSECLMGLFYLLTLYCVLRGTQSRHSANWYAISVIACALGMGSKAVMVTAPLVILLFDRTFLASSFRELFRKRSLLYGGLFSTWLVLFICGVAQGVLDPSRTSATVGFGFQDISPYQYALTQTEVILQYIKLSYWPASLCFDYNLKPATDLKQVILPALTILFLLIATVWMLIKNKGLGFVAACFFLILAPTSSFIPIKDMMFEHRMYLPLASIIIFTMIAGRTVCIKVADRFSLRRHDLLSASGIFTCAIIIMLTTLTLQRNKVYRDGITIWRDVAKKRPNNPRPFIAIGASLLQQGRFEEAYTTSLKAIRIDKNNAEAHSNAGLALSSMNLFRDAIEEYTIAIQINPDHFPAYINLGIAQAELGKIDEAIDSFRSAVQIEPRDPRARRNLGFALSTINRLQEAVEEFELAVSVDPLHPGGHYQLGIFYFKTDRRTQAISEFQKVLQIDPNHIDAQRALQSAHRRMGKP